MLAAGPTTHHRCRGQCGRDDCRGDAACDRTLITGSHYDTVANAGRYDGRLGVAAADRGGRAAAPRGHGSCLFTLEIIAFAEEEGLRFHSTFLGSSARSRPLRSGSARPP